MTINSETRVAGPFDGNDSTVSFPFTFKVFDSDEVRVVAETGAVETDLELGTDYTVVLNADQNAAPGGSVVLAAPLATGTRLTLTSALEMLQPVDLTNQGGFYPRVINSALDRLTILLQQLASVVSRTLKFPLSDGPVGDLPGRSARAGTVLAFDEATGEPVAGPDIASVNGVAGALEAINTVSGSIADVNTVADNITDLSNFSGVYYGPSAADPTTRRDGSPLQVGDLYFNTVVNALRTYNGSAWRESVSGAVTVQNLSGDGVETEFPLNYAPESEVITNVFIGGAYQQKNTYELGGANGDVLIFNEAPPAGTDNIEVVVSSLAPSDDKLRLDLAGADGAAMIGRGAQVVNSIAELRTLTKTSASKDAFVTGYYTEGDGGGGAYYLDAADVVSADNGGTVIVATDGARWKLAQAGRVTVKQFGAKGDNATDDYAAITAAVAWAMATQRNLHFTPGTYLTSAPINIATRVQISADPASRIKITAVAPHVMKLGNAPDFVYLASIGGLIIDGNGFASDGLVLERVISSDFPGIRATNVSFAGLHLRLAQLCTFNNYVCSSNVEPFTTTPINGILADTESCSANTFVNPTIEHVSGAGIRGISLINTLFLDGTSEGNAIGIDLGDFVGPFTAIGNVFIGMDLEVNSITDIKLRATAASNTFTVNAGYESPPVQIDHGANRNLFLGGVTGGFYIDSGALSTTIRDTTLLGVGRTVTDNGTHTVCENVYNLSDAAFVRNIGVNSRAQTSVPAAGSHTIDARTADYVVLEAAGATMTVNAPTNPTDGQRLDITIWNTSGGTTTVTWDAAFRIAGWVDPAAGTNRSVGFRYNAAFGRWYMVALTATDAAN